MKYLLDTNVCIKYINGSSEKIKKKISNLNPNDICLCSIVKSELYYGINKSKNKEINLNKLNDFFEPFFSLDFDDDCGKKFGEIRSELEKEGNIIGPYDLQIASIASSNDLILVTNNTKEFKRIKKLRIEDWEK
ncbi:MAG: type II toxin-antitoxin system VapC family toxin [Spirochaetes bacterium]|nr:type II toxin-antitoxin system VapC family toxin [Spirochaetota bacterium]